MSLNSNKCEVIRNSQKRKPIIFECGLLAKMLKSTTSANIWVLEFQKQKIHWNSSKFIKRNIQTHSYKLKEIAYNTYVRPLTEYAVSV